MLLTRPALFACILALPIGYLIGAGDDLTGYLDKSGNLTEILEIYDLQGGVAGFTGTFILVQKDGSWRAGQMLLEKMAEEKSGKLGKDEVTSLAKTLAARDLLRLESKGEADVNPHIVTIRFGKSVSTLTLRAGEKLPKVDAKADKLSVEERFAAICETMAEIRSKK